AGLERLGMHERIRSRLSVDDSLPAAGQGALGIEIRAGRADLVAWLAPLADAGATACALAERAVSRTLGGSCQVPLAAFAELDAASRSIRIRALVARPDGSEILRAERAGPADRAEALGREAAEELLANGADHILRLVQSVDAQSGQPIPPAHG
nr:hydroxymethylbilane synthase [Pseudomonas sp.]